MAVPLAVLVVTLTATLLVWRVLQLQVQARARSDFMAQALQAKEAIASRMLGYEEALQAAAAMLASERTVSRSDWRQFVERLDLRRNYPGIEALGFAELVRASEADTQVTRARMKSLAVGMPPAESRDEHVISVYSASFAGSDRSADYNMLDEPAHRRAMEHARDSGRATLSSWITAPSEAAPRQAPNQLFFPVYRGSHLSATREERRHSIIGFVYAAFRADDLVTSILREHPLELGLAVYDGKQADPAALLYADPNSRSSAGGPPPAFTSKQALVVAGQPWTLRFLSRPYEQAVRDRQQPLVALAAGIPLSLLLFALAWSQTTLRSRATKLAADMTAALRVSEAGYAAQAALLDLTYDVVLLRDCNNTIQYWNRAASETYGYTREEALGRTADELLKTQFPIPIEQLWKELRSAGRWEGELVHTTHDGTEVIVASRWAVRRNRHERIESILETNTNITERRRAEGERQRLEASLRQAQKLEAMGTLAGGIAHDFNNILGAILGYSELAHSAAPEDGSLRRYIDQIAGAGQRAKSLVERILAFSRSGIGERVPVDVQAIVAETLDMLGASLPSNVTLEHDLRAEDVAVVGDITQIHQVVMNLCTNAVQALKRGGAVHVQLCTEATDEPLTLLTGALPPGEYVCIRVRDTGIGFLPELRERLFDPFFTTKDVGVGTGLGLSLVHGIVADLGGGVDVASEPGQGSTFTVYLPRHGRVSHATVSKESLVYGDGEAVLLVDDEDALVRIGEEMLARLGYEPVGFTSSTAALEAFRKDPERFAIVLSDEMMPGMTGSQLAERLRAIRADVPIILMSGYASPALAARARTAGARDVLAKPLVMRDIAASLAIVLQKAPRH